MARRFTGLKLFLTLAVAGWDGYAALIRRQVALGDVLRRELAARGWVLENATPLPVVCFSDAWHPAGRSALYLQSLVAWVLASGARGCPRPCSPAPDRTSARATRT